jgi:ferredoxin-type protein NapF
VLIAAVVALLGGSRLAVWVPAASPLTAIASLVALWTVPATLWIGLVVGCIALVRRRWFCRWVCPTGTCADTASRLGLKARRRCARLPPVGQWIALVTIGGAALGYPALLWLDPLAMFSSSATLVQDSTSTAAWWGALGVALVLSLSLLWPGVWCTRLCPLGGLQDILGAIGRVPQKAAVASTGQARPTPGFRMSRRVVLGVLAGLGFSAATRTATTSPRPLRPPGALDEERFVGLCIRCGNCLRACPTRIIRPATGSHGIAALLSPMLDFTSDYCREDCTRCTEVCPSGALTRLTSEEKPAARIGLPKVDMNVCLLGDDRDCAVCRTWCPYEAIKYVFCEDPDVYTLVPQIDPEKCNGCGACQTKCPTEPVAAIVVQRV